MDKQDGLTVLIVEDEPDIAELLVYNLERDGFVVAVASSGEQGLEQVERFKPDLVVLDVMLPGINGLDVCRTLRASEHGRSLPIIMLTARTDEVDVVSGLELGADDYITKTFSAKILTARIRVVLRRREAAPDDATASITVGAISVDQVKHRVELDGRAVDLTPTEFTLLAVLARRPGRVYSRSELIDRLRDGQQVITDRAIDVQVASLRKKLGDSGHYIETVRGFGYRMAETV